jgi:hypothetical protein
MSVAFVIFPQIVHGPPERGVQESLGRKPAGPYYHRNSVMSNTADPRATFSVGGKNIGLL